MGLSFAEDAISTAVRVTSVYQKTDRRPRKAINLLSETVAEKVYRLSRADAAKQDPHLNTIVTGNDIACFFSKVTGIPIEDLSGDRSVYYRHLEDRLKDRVRGQDSAIEGVTRHLALNASGFVDQRRPRGRFLFVGPPGVGKTELALSLAEEVMQDRGSLITVNMADYAKDDALNKFIGASPGYVGFGQTPTIHSKVMMRPFSVVVLDEFEKASPVLANPLISILDGGGEDSQGRFVDFSQCIFVMTSNAISSLGLATSVVTGTESDDTHSDADVEGVSRDLKEMDEEALRSYLVSLGGIWTAPLVDRIDRIALFQPLGIEALNDILEKMIEVRRKVATSPLPPEIDLPESRRTIIDWATDGGVSPSARRIERGLLRWLTEAVSSTADMG